MSARSSSPRALWIGTGRTRLARSHVNSAANITLQNPQSPSYRTIRWSTCRPVSGGPSDERLLRKRRNALQAEHSSGDACRQQLVVWRLSSELDYRALQGADECECHRSDRRTGGDRPRSPPCFDQAGAALDERLRDPLELAPNRVILAAELKSQRDRHARDVAPAVDGVAARKGDQREDRV
jgi:hypothetical protein